MPHANAYASTAAYYMAQAISHMQPAIAVCNRPGLPATELEISRYVEQLLLGASKPQAFENRPD